MNKIKIVLIPLCVFLALLFFVMKIIFIPVEIKDSINLTIEPNFSLKQIANKLNKYKVIEYPLIFRIVAKISKKELNLKAGEYEFNTSINMWNTLKKIVNGEFKKHKITIPEGFSSYEIATYLSAQGFIDKNKFLELLKDRKILQKHGIKGNSLEGYLFPDTYILYKGLSEKKIIENMLLQFFNVFDKNLEERKKVLGLTTEEVITLASIVEKEAQAENERAIIAAVFLNRLKKRIRLESCATVLYALGKHKSRLFEDDLKVESPYNTYLHYGLPIGPIANPGLSSIKAVLYPADVDYLYFVSQNDGTHKFSNTFEEHKKNKRKFVK